MSAEKEPRSGRPIVAGLVALVAVALAVGLILAGVALVGSRMLGLSGDQSASADSSDGETLYLPKPVKTTASGPEVTLNTTPAETESGSSKKAEPTKSRTTEKTDPITLQAGQNEVGNFDPIDLTGIYPGGEGALLQVQRFEDGAWADFAATVSVSNETFSTYVQSAQTGLNRFRVVDSDNGKASNEVRVVVN